MRPEKGSVKVGDQLTVDISKIVPRGLGLGFANGSTVFVALAAPGDRVAVRVTEVKGNAAFAEIEEVITPSARRIKPPCPYFGTCGGCDFQQMDYAAQVEAKVGIIQDCLHRIGKIDYSGQFDIIHSPLEFGYRSRAQWHADINAHTIGYYRRSSHDVVDIEQCPIASPVLNETLKELRDTIEWGTIWGNRIAIEAAHGDDGGVSVYSSELTVPTQEITAATAGERFNYSAKSFFQGNRSIVEQLVNAAIDGASGATAIDLYSGVGLFTLPLARKFDKITAVEENSEAVDFAEKNAKRAELTNASFVRGKVDGFVREAASASADFILLDPPRAGGSKDTIRNIARVAATEISYVSCEPSILARDLRWLIDLGWNIERITAIDMFPQTHHVETVVRLKRQ
jgi:tRNA/tmRNA/rRNA uracil-C5-methylase (TrmA/RlmC/RlmD family)